MIEKEMHKSWNEIIQTAVKFRRDLHRSPELAWAEKKTSGAIRHELALAKIPWRAVADTGTVAMLGKEDAGRTVALRADIDAMPITEKSAVPWASEISGCMHACGHDGHTATLLAVARWLKHQEEALPEPVIFIFQPAEEGGHGARHMIESGVLENVRTVYGWHNWPAIPFGKAVCPDGTVMAANGTFRIIVKGKGGHASQPELCRDPVTAASAIVMALQQIVSRRLPPQKSAVVSVTYMEAPGKETVTPDRAILGGNIRIADDALRATVNDLIEKIAKDTARAWGVKAQIEIFPRYGATVNDPEEAGKMRKYLCMELGAQWEDKTIPLPVMASEDFHYYLNKIPGALALIGAGSEVSLHSAAYDFNDALIESAARFLIRLAGGRCPR